MLQGKFEVDYTMFMEEKHSDSFFASIIRVTSLFILGGGNIFSIS